MVWVPATLAFDEATDGYFDSACVFWKNADPIEICDVAIVRFT